jgi:excisionase family DNA binding protein
MKTQENPMKEQDIPNAITEAAVAMLRPYAPDITSAKIKNLCVIPDDKDERLLTRKEAAFALHISSATLDRMLRDGELPRRKIRGAVRIPLSAVNILRNGKGVNE